MTISVDSLKYHIRCLQNECTPEKVQELIDKLEGYSLVKTQLLIRLSDDSDFLDCLKAIGVDNWDGYCEAQEMFYDEE